MDGAHGSRGGVSRAPLWIREEDTTMTPPPHPNSAEWAEETQGACVCLRSIQSELHVNNSLGGWHGARSSGRNMCGLHSCQTYIITITTTCYEWRGPLPGKAHACSYELATDGGPQTVGSLDKPGEMINE